MDHGFSDRRLHIELFSSCEIRVKTKAQPSQHGSVVWCPPMKQEVKNQFPVRALALVVGSVLNVGRMGVQQAANQ